MLKSIREFFEQHIGAITAPRDPQELVRLAAAALWVEMIRADGRTEGAEREAVLRAAQAKFGLSEEDARTLVALADQAADDATDYYEFTTLINRHLSAQQKEQIIEHLWRVALADGEVSPREEHMVRKIADLLYVSHGAFITARQRARR